MGKEELLQHYLAHMQVAVHEINYTKCPLTWREINFVPAFNRMYLIEDGEGKIEVNGTSYYPSACDMVLMPAKVMQSYTAINAQTYLKHWVHFTALVGDRPLFQLIDTPVVLKLSLTAYEHARGLMQTLRECHMERTWISPIRKHAALLELLHLYLHATGLERIQLRSKDLDKLNVILTYMAENLDKRLTIQELAQQLHLHPNYFITYFKEHMGESPIQYMNHRKLEYAKQLLLGNTLHVNEVAERIGMDAYYFSRIFKDYTGFSPTAYMASKMM